MVGEITDERICGLISVDGPAISLFDKGTGGTIASGCNNYKAFIKE